MYHLSGGNNKIELITNVFLNTDSDLQEANDWKEKIISILKKVPSKAEVLKPAIEFLAVTLKPSKIYMMQHNNNEEDVPDNHFSLLIVLPNTSSTEQETILNIAYLTNKNVYFSLHNEGNVIEKIKAGHPFYSLNFIPENIVYDNNNTVYPVATSEQATLTRQIAKETFMKGFVKARRFYACAESEFNEGEKEITLFMLHQATELICRAITKSLSGYEEKVHEIKIQKGHIRRFAPELLSIFDEEKKEDKKLLEILERGYKDARYNYEFIVDENLLPPLFERVKQFQDKALKIMERITGL
jgi:HEPN domain-containing protein